MAGRAARILGLVLLAAAFVALLKKPVIGYVLMLMAAAVTIPFIGLVLGTPVVLAMPGVPPLLAGVVLVVESSRARPKPHLKCRNVTQTRAGHTGAGLLLSIRLRTTGGTCR